MVGATAVAESNDAYAQDQHSGLVCVFAGGTAGIGQATLERLASMLHSSTFYVLGRNKQRHAPWLDQLTATSSNKFVFIETQVSLISGIDTACNEILSAERKVDILCMSPGGMPFAGAKYTEEGLETCFAVSYYSRLRLVSNLLPLLNQCRERPARVLSILNGTKETKIDEDDLNLDKQWGIRAVVNHTTLLTSLAFDYLAEQSPQGRIVFLHATPGFVNTNTPRTKEHLPSREKAGLLQWAFLSFAQIVSGWVIRYFGMNIKESGERHNFHLTSDGFEPGSWRVDRHSNAVPDNDVLKDYLGRGWAEKAWNFTVAKWDNMD
ncbi:hypothetical protein Daus18300_005043 [Diaporthe australafricana]|uniref:Uncharacterized protein n=1 Tax=Diaporthe australafricana TaxID=127596 RepID=A0ABR3X465_9PEZI